ncbi:MAG: DEAD/DEAH box helicase [Candidatus Thorarchaeota archaeon]
MKYLKKIRHNKDVPLLLPKDFAFKEEPFRHQVVTFIYALHHKDLAIFSTMGTGKTFCGINIAKYWIEQGEANKALVVCPTAVLRNWQDEIDMFSDLSSTVLHDPIRAKRLKLFKRDTDFYIINFEATLPSRFLEQLKQLDADIIIFDESSRIANPKAQQTKACMELAGQAKYRYVLNGTPITNKPLSLWSQMYAVDFGETLGNSYTAFRREYFQGIKMQSGGAFFSVYKIRNKQSMRELAEEIDSKSIRFLKEECIDDMPDKSYHVRRIKMPPATRVLYNKMYKHAKLEIAKLQTNVSADILLTKFVKALQITSGYLKTDDGDYIEMKKNPKLDELKMLIDEIVPESAMVIWCKYLHTISLVQQMLDDMYLDYLTIVGAVTDKSAVAKLFQQTPIDEIPIIICQIRSGGVGINLHKASYAVFLENEWRLQDRYQAEDRIHRIGQKNACTYIDLAMEDSIDEQVMESVKQNRDIAEYILSRVD